MRELFHGPVMVSLLWVIRLNLFLPTRRPPLMVQLNKSDDRSPVAKRPALIIALLNQTLVTKSDAFLYYCFLSSGRFRANQFHDDRMSSQGIRYQSVLVSSGWCNKIPHLNFWRLESSRARCQLLQCLVQNLFFAHRWLPSHCALA